MNHVSPRRRREVIDALRRGTVPANGLDLLAVGLERFDTALNDELDAVAGGSAVFKAVRGEYGSGKTFFTRHVAERALRRGWATAEVQISETETPLHRLETVYRRITESLRTASMPPRAFRSVLDGWLFTLGLTQDFATFEALRHARSGGEIECRRGASGRQAPHKVQSDA